MYCYWLYTVGMLRLGHYERAKRLLDDPRFLRDVERLRELEEDELKLADAKDRFDRDSYREKEELSKLLNKLEKKARRHGLFFSVRTPQIGGLSLAISELMKKYSLPDLPSTQVWIRRLQKEGRDPPKSRHILVYSSTVEEEEKKDFSVLISDFDSEARLFKLLGFLKKRKYWQPSKKGHPQKLIEGWRLDLIFEKHYSLSRSEEEILQKVERELDELKDSGQIKKIYSRSTLSRKFRNWKPNKRPYDYWPSKGRL